MDERVESAERVRVMGLLRSLILKGRKDHQDVKVEDAIRDDDRASSEDMELMPHPKRPPKIENGLSERLARALSLFPDKPDRLTWNVFCRLIGPGPIDPSAYHFRDGNGRTMVHCAARGLASSVDSCRYWRALLKSCVRAGADLHVLERSPEGSARGTALSAFVDRWRHHPLRLLGSMPHWDYNVRFWIRQLEHAGADLLEYGRRERQLFDQGLVPREFDVCVMPIWFTWGEFVKEDHEWRPWRLIAFTYGPSPSDWLIWGSNPRDEFAGEFWEMVERGEEPMPGAQVDDEHS